MLETAVAFALFGATFLITALTLFLLLALGSRGKQPTVTHIYLAEGYDFDEFLREVNQEDEP